MRKICILVLVMILAIGLVACGSNDLPANDEPNPDTQETTESGIDLNEDVVTQPNSPSEPVGDPLKPEKPNVGTPDTKPGNSAQAQPASTLGGKYLEAFKNSNKTDADKLADELIDLDAAEIALVKMEVSEGYLDGFTSNITGFSKGVKFSPMIGSIPFVGYVFETDDTTALVKALEAAADPGWNICTRADETVSGTRGNLVFFLMCSNE